MFPLIMCNLFTALYCGIWIVSLLFGDLQLDLVLPQLLFYTNYKKVYLLGFLSRDMRRKPISSSKKRL